MYRLRGFLVRGAHYLLSRRVLLPSGREMAGRRWRRITPSFVLLLAPTATPTTAAEKCYGLGGKCRDKPVNTTAKGCIHFWFGCYLYFFFRV